MRRRQPHQPVRYLGILVAKFAFIVITDFADLESAATKHSVHTAQPDWPSLYVETVSRLYSQSILQELVLHRHLGRHLFEPAVFFCHHLYLRHQGRIHATIFGTPIVLRRVADPGFPATVRNKYSTPSLLQNCKDLPFRKS